jgi:hypothetical protein
MSATKGKEDKVGITRSQEEGYEYVYKGKSLRVKNINRRYSRTLKSRRTVTKQGHAK